MEEERPSEFLPPEPQGPEPDLAKSPEPEPPTAQHPTAETQPLPPPQQGWQQQPPPGWQGWQQQPPPPPPGWQPPPPGWAPAPGWGYPPPPKEPDNGAAVAGFVVSLVSAGLLLMSFGFLGFLSAIGAPFGIYYSRKGKQAVEAGKTPKHRGLAQAGFVIGIITLVISVIVTILGIIFIIAFATDEEFRRDLEDNDGGFDSTMVRAMLLAAQAAARLAV